MDFSHYLAGNAIPRHCDALSPVQPSWHSGTAHEGPPSISTDLCGFFWCQKHVGDIWYCSHNSCSHPDGPQMVIAGKRVPLFQPRLFIWDEGVRVGYLQAVCLGSACAATIPTLPYTRSFTSAGTHAREIGRNWKNHVLHQLWLTGHPGGMPHSSPGRSSTRRWLWGNIWLPGIPGRPKESQRLPGTRERSFMELSWAYNSCGAVF